MRFVAEGREASGYLRNVSRAGIFICATELPRPGATVALQFDSPDGELVNLRGEVRWNAPESGENRQPDGFGVLLREPPREYRGFFLWALEQVEKAGS